MAATRLSMAWPGRPGSGMCRSASPPSATSASAVNDHLDLGTGTRWAAAHAGLPRSSCCDDSVSQERLAGPARPAATALALSASGVYVFYEFSVMLIREQVNDQGSQKGSQRRTPSASPGRVAGPLGGLRPDPPGA